MQYSLIVAIEVYTNFLINIFCQYMRANVETANSILILSHFISLLALVHTKMKVVVA